MLLDSCLADNQPLEIYDNITKGTIFFGCEIKSLYDEKRITIKPINDNKPKRFSYKPSIYANSQPIFLYGFSFTPKGADKHLINELAHLSNIDLITYTNILEKYGYESGENFLKLTQNIYPLDNVHIERYIPDINYDAFFDVNPEFPAFQQLTSINMYILV